MDPYHWITDPDLDPFLVFSGFQDANKNKILFKKKFFGLLLIVDIFKSVFINNKLLSSHKTVEKMIFFIFSNKERKLGIGSDANFEAITSKTKTLVRAFLSNTARQPLTADLSGCKFFIRPF